MDELEASRAQQWAASPDPLAATVVNRAAKHTRQPLPAHLPRETRKVLPKQEACPDCGGDLKLLGEDVSEMLEWVPEHFKVIRQVRPKLTCACCDKIVQAEAASRPIARGMAGPGLLAHVLVSKYAHHLPLYRQSEIYARDGVELDRSTMAEWIGGCSRLLEALVEALRRHVMSAGKLHAEDTPVPVLAPGKCKTKTGRLWTYVRDDRPWGDQSPPAVWFAYTPDRKGQHPKTHLREFTGTLQADGYAGYDVVYEGGRVNEAACMSHVRRPFYELYEAHKSAVAKEALERIAALYVIEDEVRGRSAEERREVRKARNRPLLESLKKWFEETLGKLSMKSDTTKAIRYALRRWEAVMRFCDDGHLEIDNNAERHEALKAGVKGYVLKNQVASDLIHAIQQVSRGEFYLSLGISRAVMEAYRTRADRPADPLTVRERQVLQLIAEGKSTKDTACVLGISVKTAESHRMRLMQKLDIHETASLVRYAVRRGLMQP